MYKTVRIGDDVPFTLESVTDKRPGEPEVPLPDATVTWELLETETGESVLTGSGSMALYDAVNAHFKAKLAKELTETLVEKRKYSLVMIVNYDGDEGSFTVLFTAESRTEETLNQAV